MATKIVTEPQAREFWNLGAEYQIAPGAKARDLLTDAGCLLEASLAVVQALIDGLGDQGSQMSANPKDAVALLFGVLYQLEMTKNLVNASEVAA